MLRTALSALAGVVALHQLPALPRPAWAVPIFVLVLALLSRPRLAWLLGGVAGFAWAWWIAADTLMGRLPAQLHGQDLRLVGYVAGFVAGDSQRLTFNFHVSPDHLPVAVPARWRLSWYRPTHPLQAGQDLQVVVRARQPRSLGNPASFDYQGWLFRERLGGTGYIRELHLLDSRHVSPAQWWLRQRARLYRQLTQAATGPGTVLLGALAVGARHEFGREHWSILRRTGTSHLVAISGLHVGLVGLGVFAVLRALLVRVPWMPVALRAQDLAVALALVVAGVYSALAGFGVPTQRALVMLAVAALGLISGRALRSGDALATALLAVLLVDPLAVLAAGFWLSFGAVAALLLALSPRRLRTSQEQSKPGHRAVRWLTGLVRAQWAVGLGLAPVLLLSFGELSTLAPLVNLLAVPWFSFCLVPLTLLTTLTLGLVPGLGTTLLGVLAPLADGTWWLLALLAQIPWASLVWPRRPVLLVMLALAGTVAFFVGRGLPGRSLFLTLLLPLFNWRAPLLPPGDMRLTVLDVGQGLAAVVETRHHVLVYDAGPGLPGGFDAGDSVVAPSLRSRGWKSIDRLVIGHADLDHAGGADSLLRAFPDALLIAGPGVKTARAVACYAGQGWQWDGIRFQFLHPARGHQQDGNNSSCVLRVDGAGGSLLLTGDIEAAAEVALIARQVPLAVDVVVVPHHGSRTSSTAAFVNAVRPTMAVVPAGFRNRWDLPDERVVQRWRNQGARLWTTGDVGQVQILFDQGGPAIEGLGRRARYWHPL